MIDLREVGARALPPVGGVYRVSFGLYLPGITYAGGYRVLVKIIHRSDRFDPEIQTQNFYLSHQAGHPQDLWNATVDLNSVPNTSFGSAGTYLYRFQLLQATASGSERIVTNWFTDPFATATDVGELSAFTTDGFEPPFAWTDVAYKTPELDDLVVYELQVEEFNDSFDGVIERLDYLQSLGVNVLELMPVSSLKLDFDWGYGPLHYFAPNARWGGVAGLKRLVDACHSRGIAVILDVVYQHVDGAFPYKLVYADSGQPSPMIGRDGPFGPEVDYSKVFAQEYVAKSNEYWLQEFHVDGFRYDEVTDLFTGATDTAYSKLAFETYNMSHAFPRFQGPRGYSRLIQVAEALGKARAVLRDTFTNAVWQDELLNKSEDMAQYGYVDDSFAHFLDPSFGGYPQTKQVTDSAGNAVDMPVAPFQYIETHDHSQLISFVATTRDDPADVPFGDRSKFYKIQPFAIALYTCQGIPMLWQGQEIVECWTLPPSGRRRISFRRDVHWEYFYDTAGSTVVNLYRRLGKLRKDHRSLRSRESYYFYQQANLGAKVCAYSRHSSAQGELTEETAIVFLNFSDADYQMSIPFARPGRYRELLDHQSRIALGQAPLEIVVANAGDIQTVRIPSNYGAIFVSM